MAIHHTFCRCNSCDEAHQTIPKVLALSPSAEKGDKSKPCTDRDHLDRPDPGTDSSLTSERGSIQSHSGLLIKAKDSLSCIDIERKDQRNALGIRQPVEDLTHKAELRKEHFFIESQPGCYMVSHPLELAKDRFKTLSHMPPNDKNVDLNLIASLTPAQVNILGKDFGNSDRLKPLKDGAQKCKIFDVHQSHHTLKMKVLYSVRNMCMKKSISNENLRNLFLSYQLQMSEVPVEDQTDNKHQGKISKNVCSFSNAVDDDIDLLYNQFSSSDKNLNPTKTRKSEEEKLLPHFHIAELVCDREPLIPVEDSFHFPSTLPSSSYPEIPSHCKLPPAADRSEVKLHLSVEGGQTRNKSSANSFTVCSTGRVFSHPKDRSVSEPVFSKTSASDADKMVESKIQLMEADGITDAEFMKGGNPNDVDDPDDTKTIEKAEEEESEKTQLASLERKPVSVTIIATNKVKPKRRKREKKGKLRNQMLQHKKEEKSERSDKDGQAKCKQQIKKAVHGLPVKKPGKLRKQCLDDRSKARVCTWKSRKPLFKTTPWSKESDAKLKDSLDQQGMDQVSMDKQLADMSGQMQCAGRPGNVVFPTQIESGEVQRDMSDDRSLSKRESVLDKTVEGNSTRVLLTSPAKAGAHFEGIGFNRHAGWLSKMNHYLREREGKLLSVWWSVDREMMTQAGRYHARLIGNYISFEIVPCHPVSFLWDERLDLASARVRFVSSSNVSGGGGSGGSACGGGSSGNKGTGNSQNRHASQGYSRRSNSSDGDDDEDKERPWQRFERTPVPVYDPEPSKEHHSAFLPPSDFKRYRKKQHGVASNEQLCHCLGQAGVGLGILRQSSGIAEVNKCLWLCLHDMTCVTSPSLEDLTCCTCVVLHSLLSHFAMSPHDRSCHMCMQLFNLIAFHIQQCRDLQQRKEGQSDVCYRMIAGNMFVDELAELTNDLVWGKVRKYLGCALAPILVLPVGAYHESQTMEAASLTGAQIARSAETVQEPTTVRDVHASTGVSSVAQGTVSSSSAVLPKHGVLRRKPSGPMAPIKMIPEEEDLLLAAIATENSLGSESLLLDATQTTATAATAVLTPASSADGAMTAGLTLDAYSAPSSGLEEQEDMRPFIIQRAQEMEGGNAKPSSCPDDPYATQKTYGKTGIVSMPEGRQNYIQNSQMLSLESKPTGTPGIGEVVYGTRHQLLRVARNWQMERDQCRSTGYCNYQHREEGVILDKFRKNLRILHTRYQKHHQWERLVHLGNGVTGKCHLCIDRTSNFKFCCKKIHILSYDDNELDIWSDLYHHNIVNFYGAIRHGRRIYLFAEFIDGGSLTSVINEQYLIGRRLSHWTALNYFRQLLDVLIYLKSRGILHEDIKADNLLLREGTTEIVLADFGVAQRICNDHVPRGQSPAGSPAHWSPEKAASEGHGFPSDLWAAACVLIHMLGGSPPWIKRFRNADVLNFLIWSNPPPMDDVPATVRDSVRDLIGCCLIKDATVRPSAKQIRIHQAFQMLMNQASSFFSTFTQTVPVGHAEQDQGTTDVGSQVDEEACPTGIVSPGTELGAVGGIAKPQHNHRESSSYDKASALCDAGVECPATASHSAAVDCNGGSKQMIGLSQIGACSCSEDSHGGAGCEDAENEGAAGRRGQQTKAENVNQADRTQIVKLSVRPVFAAPAQHPYEEQRDELQFNLESLPEVPDSLVCAVHQSSRTLSIPFSPELPRLRSPLERKSFSDLGPYGSANDSESMELSICFPRHPQPLQDKETAKTVTPEGAHPSMAVARYDYLKNPFESPGMAAPKTQNPRKLTVPLTVSDKVYHPEPCSHVTIREFSTCVTNEEHTTWSDFNIAPATNLSVIHEDVDEASSATSREEHWWDFIQDQFASSFSDETVHQGPVCGQVPLHVYQGILPHDGDTAAAASVDSTGAASTIPPLPRVTTLPKFKELLFSVSNTFNSGNISGKNAPSCSGCGTSQQDTNNDDGQNVNLFPGLARCRVDQGTGDDVEAFPVMRDEQEEEERSGRESCAMSCSNEEHISSGDLFGPGPLQTEKPQVAGAVSPSLIRKNPNLRLDVTKGTASTAATGKLTAAASAGVSQHLSPVDNKGTHDVRQPQLHDERDIFSGKITEPSVFTPSSLTPSPQSATALPGRVKPTSGPPSHRGSGSSTPRSAYEQQEQQWNLLQQEIPPVLTLDPDSVVEAVSESNIPSPPSYQEQERWSYTSSAEEDKVLFFLQDSSCNQTIAGCCLNFYDHQGEHLFSLRMPSQHRSWRELVAAVQSKVHNAGYQHFTLTYMETCGPVDFFSPPEVMSIQVSKVSEDGMDTCWCDSHLIHGD